MAVGYDRFAVLGDGEEQDQDFLDPERRCDPDDQYDMNRD